MAMDLGISPSWKEGAQEGNRTNPARVAETATQLWCQCQTWGVHRERCGRKMAAENGSKPERRNEAGKRGPKKKMGDLVSQIARLNEFKAVYRG
jgi:hypothetical protein